MKHAMKMRWLANPIMSVAFVSHNIWSSCDILFTSKVNILMLVKWSYNPPPQSC